MADSAFTKAWKIGELEQAFGVKFGEGTVVLKLKDHDQPIRIEKCVATTFYRYARELGLGVRNFERSDEAYVADYTEAANTLEDSLPWCEFTGQ